MSRWTQGALRWYIDLAVNLSTLGRWAFAELTEIYRIESDFEARRHATRALHVHQDEDGMVVLRGRLAPEVGALLVQALAAARETLYRRVRSEGAATDPAADPPTMAQQQADALTLLAEAALHHGIGPGAPGERYQVVVHVDAAALADPDQPGQSVLEDGAHVPAETSRRLACNASRVVTGAPRPCTDGVPGVAGRAPGSGLGDRRPAPPGQASRGDGMIASAADCVRGRIVI